MRINEELGTEIKEAAVATGKTLTVVQDPELANGRLSSGTGLDKKTVFTFESMDDFQDQLKHFVSENTRRIVVVHCDGVAKGSTISFRFMFDAKIPPAQLMINNGWGLIWMDKDSYPINVIKGGSLLMGGGWDKDSKSDEWDKSMLDAIPSCTLLMDSEVFKFWKALCEKHEVRYEAIYHEGLLKA
tara:strand:+ start:539 stop:1096 length:558 start_codon:yes stop_codon:yes gene_type:complete